MRVQLNLVLIAAHNSEDTLRICISSALFGLGKHDEVLVLLDACKDNSEAVAFGFRDKRVRVFRSDEQLGRDGARNFLLQHAKGKFISILDSDDISLPWRFYFARRHLRKYDAVFGTAIVFGEGVSPLPFLPQVPRCIRPEQLRLELLVRNPLVHSMASIRRTAFDVVGGYRLPEAQDYDLWLRLGSTGQTLYRTGFPVSCYRVHQGQASKSRGFMLSTSKSPPIEAEKANLARKLTSSVKGWPESKESLIDQIKRQSLLARIEINGLASWL